MSGNLGAQDRERAEALLSKARQLRDEARRSDYRMPLILPFLAPILAFIAGLASIALVENVGAALSVLAILYVLTLVVYVYVLYKWVDRRNSHFTRSSLMFQTLSELASVLGLKGAELVRGRYDELASANSSRRSVAGNVIGAMIIPFYIIYVFHFLNKDFVKHSERESILIRELIGTLKERDPSFALSAEEFRTIGDRSTLLYVILAIVTLGLFNVYWVYVLTKDPNEHFESHMNAEPKLIASFERIVA